jgi:hypothetical protein
MLGAEPGSTSELNSAGSGVTADAVTFNSAGGAYSYKFAGNFGQSILMVGLNVSRAYGRCYFRFDTDTAPGAILYVPIIWIRDTVGNTQCLIVFRQLTDGTYRIGVFNAALAETQYVWAPLKDTWYRIEFDLTKGAGTGALSIYIDGVLFQALASQNYGAGNIGSWSTDSAANNAARNIYLDDIVLDDAALPGAGYIVARQFGPGTPTYDAWTKNGGATIDAVWDDTPFSAATSASSFLSSTAQTALLATFLNPQSGHGLGCIGSGDTIGGAKVGLVGKTAATTAAGIAQVGNILATSSLNGVDVTLTFSTAPITGDVVYLWGGHTSTRPTPIGPSTAGYTLLGTVQTATTNTFGVWRKVMGATPDTTVVGQGTGNAADSVGYGCIVLRQVNTSTPEDVAITFANGSSTNPDAPSITPATNGAAVIICASTVVSDSAWVNPANYSATVAAGSNDTNPYSIGGSVRLTGLVGGTPESPAAFTSVLTGVWIAASIAVKPATQAGSAASIRRRLAAADTDSAITLTTSDAYFETAIFTDTLANLNAGEAGILHGSNSFVQTVEDVWMMVSYTPGDTLMPQIVL